MSRYSWLILEWIWQGLKKTKMNIGTFFGSAIITGYFEGEEEEGELTGKPRSNVKRRRKGELRLL